ncbi:MAG: HD domain-containing protein [Chloroflexales bacterium]|nr:HD domain-containing protein [Chloroflexales bacterium]
MRSVRYSYRLAPLMRADRQICMRAAILHDIDSRYGTLTTHGAIAAQFAAAQGESELVCQAIVSHMYPFGPAPTTREGWVLVVADKIASLSDMTVFVRGLFTGRSQRVRRSLSASDPFHVERPRRARLMLRLRRNR